MHLKSNQRLVNDIPKKIIDRFAKLSKLVLQKATESKKNLAISTTVACVTWIPALLIVPSCVFTLGVVHRCAPSSVKNALEGGIEFVEEKVIELLE